jgi:hypothetical protein
VRDIEQSDIVSLAFRQEVDYRLRQGGRIGQA